MDMNSKDITKEYILNHFDIDKERLKITTTKNKKFDFKEILDPHTRFTTVRVSFDNFIEAIKKEAEKFIKEIGLSTNTDFYVEQDSWDDFYISVDNIRPETDDEVIERLMKEEDNNLKLKRKKDKRYQQFLKLKKEFEEE